MSSNRRIEDFEATLPAELDALWKRWNEGALAHHAAQLKTFAAQERAIIQARAGQLDSHALITAAKSMVVELGSVHPPSEMRDQIREIQNYLWFQGQTGHQDRARIVNDWTASHANNWRQWRLKEYLFVIDRVADELVSPLRTSI